MSPPPRHAGPLPAPAPDAQPQAEERNEALTGPARGVQPGQYLSASLGRTPPDVPFTVARGPGSEDGFVGFARDSANVSAPEGERLAALVAGSVGSSREPVTVTVHGYASGEGDAVYNDNLSAHRAAAVQRLLVPLLPPGSEVRLVAHGETDAFGEEPAANRRAGVDIEPRSDVPYAQQAAPVDPSRGRTSVEVGNDGDGNSVAVDPDGPAPAGAARTDLSILPPLPRLRLTPGLLEPQPSDLARPFPAGWWLRPPDPALSLFDDDVYAPLRSRGIPVDDRWTVGVESHYQFWFWRLHRGLGLRADWAAWLANTGAGVWLDTEAARERPTVTDEFNRERDLDHRLQGAWKTPIVPLHPTIRFDLSDLFRK